MRKSVSLGVFVLAIAVVLGIGYLIARVPSPSIDILTAEDFTGHGLLMVDVDPTRATFTVEISPILPLYLLRVSSRTSIERGRIDVFVDADAMIPIQTIELDPNMRLADEVPTFFNAADVNFDGFLDIGVLVDGGATWGSYQYWMFDQETGTFVTSPLTEDLRDIAFNTIAFDTAKKQIVVEDIRKKQTIYQFQDGRLRVAEE